MALSSQLIVLPVFTVSKEQMQLLISVLLEDTVRQMPKWNSLAPMVHTLMVLEQLAAQTRQQGTMLILQVPPQKLIVLSVSIVFRVQ